MIKDNDNAHRNSNDNVALRQDREDALPRGTAYHNSDDNIDSLHRVVGSWTWVCSRRQRRQPRVREGHNGVAEAQNRVLRPLAPGLVPPGPPGLLRQQFLDALLQILEALLQISDFSSHVRVRRPRAASWHPPWPVRLCGVIAGVHPGGWRCKLGC